MSIIDKIFGKTDGDGADDEGAGDGRGDGFVPRRLALNVVD